MKKKTTELADLPTDTTSNIAVMKAFESIVSTTKDLMKVFDTEKYRTAVTIDHEQIGKFENLIKEFICYHCNLTLAKNKHGRSVIYISYDSEATGKFGFRLFTQLLRTAFSVTAVENTKVNIEEHLRIDFQPNEVRNFFYKRLMDQPTPHVSIELIERTTA